MRKSPFITAALALCLLCLGAPAVAQSTGDNATVSQQKAYGKLTFFSDSEVRFFVYLNGKLQNETSTGRITLNGLEDKPYHVRIVMDDPFEAAATRTIRPSKAPEEYIVDFNPVKERVHISRHKVSAGQDNAFVASGSGKDRHSFDRRKDKEKKEKRLSKREQAEVAAAKASTGKDIKSTKTPYLKEE